MKHKVVIDASVLISACYGGHPLDALSYCFSSCLIYASSETVEEISGLQDRITRKIGREKAERFGGILSDILSRAIITRVNDAIKLCRDKTDNKYLALCKRTGANFLLTRDKDLLSINTSQLKQAGLKRLKIVTPTEFLIMVTNPN